MCTDGMRTVILTVLLLSFCLDFSSLISLSGYKAISLYHVVLKQHLMTASFSTFLFSLWSSLTSNTPSLLLVGLAWTTLLEDQLPLILQVSLSFLCENLSSQCRFCPGTACQAHNHNHVARTCSSYFLNVRIHPGRLLKRSSSPTPCWSRNT